MIARIEKSSKNVRMQIKTSETTATNYKVKLEEAEFNKTIAVAVVVV